MQSSRAPIQQRTKDEQTVLADEIEFWRAAVH
jgi:hypothetical protein